MVAPAQVQDLGRQGHSIASCSAAMNVGGLALGVRTIRVFAVASQSAN